MFARILLSHSSIHMNILCFSSLPASQFCIFFFPCFLPHRYFLTLICRSKYTASSIARNLRIICSQLRISYESERYIYPMQQSSIFSSFHRHFIGILLVFSYTSCCIPNPRYSNPLRHYRLLLLTVWSLKKIKSIAVSHVTFMFASGLPSFNTIFLCRFTLSRVVFTLSLLYSFFTAVIKTNTRYPIVFISIACVRVCVLLQFGDLFIIVILSPSFSPDVCRNSREEVFFL